MEDESHHLAETIAAITRLFASADEARLPEDVARLAVTWLADWCALDLTDADGPRYVTVATADPSLAPFASRLEGPRPAEPAHPHPVVTLLGGQPRLYPDLPLTLLARTSQDAEQLHTLLALGARSAILVPLVAHGRALGTMLLVTANRRYGDADLALAAGAGKLFALALDSARLRQVTAGAGQDGGQAATAAYHDLKNPLTVIALTTQLLRHAHGAEAWDPIRADEQLARIEAAGARMLWMLDGLLDASQLGAGKPLQLDRRLTDLVVLVEEAAADLRATTERHAVTVDETDDDVTGVWDSARLRRVLENLLMNAMKYSPEGGAIRLSVRREEDATGAWAVLRVSDSGVGIPATDLPHVLEGYFRASNVRGSIRGTGIGLASARQIAEQHGGSLSLESREGEGTTAILRLPLPTRGAP